jgi:hypothetical protein
VAAAVAAAPAAAEPDVRLEHHDAGESIGELLGGYLLSTIENAFLLVGQGQLEGRRDADEKAQLAARPAQST